MLNSYSFHWPLLIAVFAFAWPDSTYAQPEFIIVGITWGGKDPNAGMLRGRDFTPTQIAQMPSGQGPKFLIAAAPGNMKIVLQAETDKDFYVKGAFLKVHFKTDDANKVTGFQLEQSEGSIFAKKI